MKPWVLCAAVAIASIWTPAHAGAIPTAAEYSAGIHAARVALDAAARRGTYRFASGDTVLLDLSRLTQVRLRDGRVLTTDTPDLVAALRSQSPVDVHSAIDQINALDDDLRLGQKAGAGIAPQQSSLAAVLAGPQFHLRKSPLQQLQDWLSSVYRSILQSIFRGMATSAPAQAITALLFLAVVGVVALLAVRGALNTMTVESAAREGGEDPDTSAEASRHADERMAAGDFRGAMRYLFLATLLQLQEQGVLQLAPGKTNREYLRSLGGSLHAGEQPNEAFLALVDTFDRVWYGHEPFAAEEYERSRNLAAQVVREARRSTAA